MPLPFTSRLPSRSRVRLRFVALALAAIAGGLAIHRGGAALGPMWQDILGDAIWAMMMTWWISAVVPDRSLRVRGSVAFAICVAVETSQLVHTPALDALRDLPGVSLVLGSGFDPRDLAAYLAGVLGAAVLEG